MIFFLQSGQCRQKFFVFYESSRNFQFFFFQCLFSFFGTFRDRTRFVKMSGENHSNRVFIFFFFSNLFFCVNLSLIFLFCYSACVLSFVSLLPLPMQKKLFFSFSTSLSFHLFFFYCSLLPFFPHFFSYTIFPPCCCCFCSFSAVS